jgi:hypothetical protein
MPPVAAPISVSEALWRYGGMYGAAYRDGRLLSEVVEVTGAVEIGRIEVPLVGQTKQGYKPGRETREGTLRIQKIDTSWELEVREFLATSLAQRRANRDAGVPNQRPFSLQIEFDDPDALGIEKWQLDGCLLWRMPLGFSITDDIVDREFPLTWEVETPLYAFRRTTTAAGMPGAQYEGELGVPM